MMNSCLKHQQSKSSSIEGLITVSRLKVTTVQTGYTRQQPIDIDLFLGVITPTKLNLDIRQNKQKILHIYWR